uniref:Secreted protein n=1 Tax=Anopheles darlingi TaxID=43151 RepID=A0A2M4D115_ANODA
MVMVVIVAVVTVVPSSSSSSFTSVMMSIVTGVVAVTGLLTIPTHWLRIFLLRPTIIVTVVDARATIISIVAPFHYILATTTTTTTFHSLHSLHSFQALHAHRILATFMGPRCASSFLAGSFTIAVTVERASAVGTPVGSVTAATVVITTGAGGTGTILARIKELLVWPIVPRDVTRQNPSAADTAFPTTTEQIAIRPEKTARQPERTTTGRGRCRWHLASHVE